MLQKIGRRVLAGCRRFVGRVNMPASCRVSGVIFGVLEALARAAVVTPGSACVGGVWRVDSEAGKAV